MNLPKAKAVLTALVAALALASTFVGFDAADATETTPPLSQVVAAGDFQTLLGCEENWQPTCEASELDLDEGFNLYTAEFELPAGTYEYKITGGDWENNWGEWGAPDGANIRFDTNGDTVAFVFDPRTGESLAANSEDLVTVSGTFQDQVGCKRDWQPSCLGSVMFPQEDASYRYAVSGLPQGEYKFKVTRGLSWGESWGKEGEEGADLTFKVGGGDEQVEITWDSQTGVAQAKTSSEPLPGEGFEQAIWLDEGVVAWPVELSPESSEASAKGMHYSLEKWEKDVRVTPGDLTDAEKDRDRRTKRGYIALRLTNPKGEELKRGTLQEILRGPVVFTASEENPKEGASKATRGKRGLFALTGTQTSGVLDALYSVNAQDEQLGVSWEGETPRLGLWAPTAKNVALELWREGENEPETYPAKFNSKTGVWSVLGEKDWADGQYLWDVEVYVFHEGKTVNNLVTDPYSKGLTVDSKRSVVVNMEDPKWQPEDWGTSFPKLLRNHAEQTIYELHVREFSIWDHTVTEENRGSYMAFTESDADGMKHLAKLADAGITTVHLLPTFDIATSVLPELRANQKHPAISGKDLVPNNLEALFSMEDFGPATTTQQATIYPVRSVDGFNWGYDPLHWGTPEGSYATAGNQDGGNRNLQYREMVSALHDLDLHVVQDVVFNHTLAHGQSAMSVLDRIIPGYYYRLDGRGSVESSSCCSNIATEHIMAEKIMVDTVVGQAVDYHIDGFRFDLMGHHSLENMENVRAALDALTVEKDGVDGSRIYIYGEGWDFGEVAGGRLFLQPTFANIAGTHMGLFNDRLRDAVRGGASFDQDVRGRQGFGTGQYTDPNEVAVGSPEEQRNSLTHGQEAIMAGLAGSLRDFEVPTPFGMTRAEDLDYKGQTVGFTDNPEESVNYVEAHDNETLFDNAMLKLPADSDMETRLRMQVLSNATVLLGQSPAFLASGTEMLRSKSLDRDSYNSGDWFNALDWTLSWNGFAKGLPVEEKNGSQWDAMRPLLEDPANLPDKAAMQKTQEMTFDLLRLRSSTPLFTLGNAELIKQKVFFPNAGANTTPGVIVMAIDDPSRDRMTLESLGAEDAGTKETGWASAEQFDGPMERPQVEADLNLDGVLVIFNATPSTWVAAVDGMAGRAFTLSEIQAQGADPIVKNAFWDQATGTASVPARTVAVFEERPTDIEPTAEGQETPAVAAAKQKITRDDALRILFAVAVALIVVAGVWGLSKRKVTR